MSFTYAERKKAAPRAQAAPERMAALSRGAVKPTSAEMGHRVDLPDAMRAKMESSFGADFSGVKLYESQAVGDAGAEAITQDSSIAFAPGKLDFSSSGGQALLGHELSHVVSQQRGEVAGGGFLNDHALEARADREGAMAARGESVYGGASAPLSAVSAAPAAGPMQAKRKKKEQAPKLAEPKAAGTNSPDSTPVDQDWANMSQASMSGDANSIKSAYDVIAQKQSDNVTDEQFDAVNDYIADSNPINGYLRGNLKMNEEAQNVQKKKIELIDQAMSKNRLGANVKGYRGVSDVALAALLKQSGDKKLLSVLNKDQSINHKKFAKVKDRLKGVEFTDAGFGSTSVNEQYAERWRQGIVNREASTKIANEQFEKHRDDADVQAMIKDVTSTAGVNSFEELNNTDQHFIKEHIPMYSQQEEDEWSEKKEKMMAGMGSHMYEINAPKGAKATMIDRMRKDEYGQKRNAGQQEMLVGRNARYKITDILPMMKDGVVQKNQYRIIMELLKDEEEMDK